MTNIKILNLFWPHQTFLNDLSKRLKQFFKKFLTPWRTILPTSRTYKRRMPTIMTEGKDTIRRLHEYTASTKVEPRWEGY